MGIDPLAGQPAPADLLIDISKLERAYYDRQPDVNEAAQLVSFGTSGHRGSSLDGSFNEAHILATTQAICDYRRGQGITGLKFLSSEMTA
jgi:phosphoglucomutase